MGIERACDVSACDVSRRAQTRVTWLPRRAQGITLLGSAALVGALVFDFFYEIVLNGAMKDAGMAPFKPVLDQKDAAAIRAYLIKRANEDKLSAAK